jgi:hypothetical protein
MRSRQLKGTQTVPDTRFSKSIAALLQDYATLENECDIAISTMERLSQTLVLDLINAPQSIGQTTELTGLETNCDKEVSFRQVRFRARFADTALSRALPLKRKRVLLSVLGSGFDDIESLRAKIEVLRARLLAVESDIYNATPTCVRDSVQKIRFLTAILLNGDDLDVDFYAFLVDECAQIIEFSA